MLSAWPASSMINTFKSKKKIVERAIYITAIVQKLHGNLKGNDSFLCDTSRSNIPRQIIGFCEIIDVIEPSFAYGIWNHEIFAIVRTVHIFIQFV